MQTLLRARWIALGLVIGTVVSLWAQEAQMINRPLNVTVGNVSISRGGVISGGAVNRDYRVNTTISGDTNTTYTAAQILTGDINRIGPQSARTDSLPTAANLVAAMPGVQAGSSFWLLVQAYNGNVVLNGASTGVTYAGQCGETLASRDSHLVLITITSSGAYRATCIKSDA